MKKFAKIPGGRLTQKRKLHPCNPPTRWDSFQGKDWRPKLREIPGFPWFRFAVPPQRNILQDARKQHPRKFYISRMSTKALQIYRQSQGPQKVKRYTIVFQSSMFGRELLNFGGCTLPETHSELGACENQICWKMIVTLWDKRPMFRGSCC